MRLCRICSWAHAVSCPRTPVAPVVLLGAMLMFGGVQRVCAQLDTLAFKNGDKMVGEIKSLDRGVAVVSTDYSDTDFKISWS